MSMFIGDGSGFDLIEHMDYNWLEKTLYLSDTKQRRIFKLNLDNHKESKNLIDLKDSQCNGIAVDPCQR